MSNRYTRDPQWRFVAEIRTWRQEFVRDSYIVDNATACDVFWSVVTCYFKSTDVISVTVTKLQK